MPFESALIIAFGIAFAGWCIGTGFETIAEAIKETWGVDE